MKYHYLIKDRNFWKVALRLALPVAIQNVLTSSFQLVDTMMVSRLGDVALSSVGMASQLGWFSALLTFGLCSGMSVFVSQYWGIRDLRGIRRTLGMTLISGMTVSCMFMFLALAAPEGVLHVFNRDPAVVASGCRYLTIVCFSYPAVMLTNVLSTLLRNTERVKLPMYVSMVTTLVNAAANYVLIFGAFGMPRLGIAGAAIATCISSWLGPVLLLICSFAEKNMLAGKLSDLLKFSMHDLSAFFSRAMPVMLNEGLWAAGILTLNSIYSNMGYEYYAGMTIYKTFAELAFAFYVGLGNACVIMVGKSVGQGKISRAVDDAERFSFLMPAVGLVIGGIMILLRHQLVSIFSAGESLSVLTITTALAVTVFCSAESWMRNISYVQVVGVFRSGGDTLTGMLIDLGSLWLFSIPLAFAADRLLHLPFLGVVIVAYLAEDIPKAILCLLHLKTRRWLKPVTEEGRAGLKAYRDQQ